MDQKELPLDEYHLGVPSSVPKNISKPMVCSVQTMHLSCIETNTISKRTKTSFHLTNVTKKSHQVCLKRFPCPWYIRYKLYTCLAPRLILSLNRPKWTSTWHTSHRSSIGCAQNYFHNHGTFGPKPCTYLVLRLALSPNGSKWASTWPTSPSSTIEWTQNDFHAHGTFGANHAPMLRRGWHYLQTV
jgi:hypothetical protein